MPLVSVDAPTPATIAAAAVKCFTSIMRVPPQTLTTLVTSCLVGYAEITNGEHHAAVLPLRIGACNSPIL
jgi:hypothetical protein